VAGRNLPEWLAVLIPIQSALSGYHTFGSQEIIQYNTTMRAIMLAASFVFAMTSGQLHGGEKSVYAFTMKDIDGNPVSLAKYKDKVMLIVNVASKCGNTPQYEKLQKLHDTYKDRGLAILGFPANNFLWQEPGTDPEIKQFCTLTYGVTFDMFSKISVKGKDQAPLYRFLTSSKSNPQFAGSVKWNFQKYLIDKSGKIVGRFSPGTDPLSEEIISAVEAALQAPSDKH
jgi:glutathione peroxidase